MIKISPSISSFPLPPFQKQPSEHDTRGRRSSLSVVGGGKKGYRFVSRLLRRLCTICTKAAFAADAAMCAASGTAAGRRPAAYQLLGRPSGNLSLSVRGRSVFLWRERRGNYVYLLWFVYPLYPSFCPLPPHSAWLPRCCSLGAAACGCGGRCGGGRLISDVVWPKAISKTAPAPDQSDGRKDRQLCGVLLPLFAINTPSTVGLIFAFVDVDRRR